MNISISLDNKELKLLEKRAKKNLLSLKEQIEDIVRRSCISGAGKVSYTPKIDDSLVEAFSRVKRKK